jgi:hypothetical protein
MHCHEAELQKLAQLVVAPAEVIDPNRGIDQDQASVSSRRRGAGSSSGSLPPNLASRLALSRSINAFNPSRTIAERSFEPISFMALASSSSSMFIVVRIPNSRHMHQI